MGNVEYGDSGSVPIEGYFFGGGGLGTPVVSYEPRPILRDEVFLVIMVDCVGCEVLSATANWASVK